MSRDGLVSQPTEPQRPSGRLGLGFANQNLAEMQALAVTRADQQVTSAKNALEVAATPAAMTNAVKAAEKAIADARRALASRQQVQRLEAALLQIKSGLNRKLDEAEDIDRRRARDAAIAGNLALAAVMNRRAAVNAPARQTSLTDWWLGVPAHLRSDSASEAERALAEGYAQVGRRPINSQFAGERFPLTEHLAAKYPNSVEFSAQGFPDFSPYAIATVELPYIGIDRKADFDLANEMRGLPQEDGFVWHHVEDGKIMVLVPRDLHVAISHAGGIAHENNVVGIERLLTNYLLHSDNEDGND